MIAIPSTETKNLTLLPHFESDLHAMNDYLSEERISFITGPFNDVGTWRTLLASIIEHRESGEMAGAVRFLHHFDWPETNLSWNVHHDFKCTGVAYETALIAQPYGKTFFRINGMISFINAANTRSAMLAKRLRATFEKTHFLRKYEPHFYRHPLGDPPKKATQSETNK